MPADVAAAVEAQVVELLRDVDGLVLGYESLPDEVPLGVDVDAIARLDADGRLLLDADGSPLAPHEIAAVLVPARVFDRNGYRLGRGGGHYDRLLPTLQPGVPVIGITCTARIVDELPREPHDRPMTHLATETTLFSTS
ncbi:5-formyltetrahydrofolate cyclo-ligase [Actinospongicola halichondriae]|uniref:5-formyltetrahydrofolate cyclo-ligase n=1 Tax=Actinospongicola halichondriae TaxID=3236844 RepID=UPI003D4AE621